MIFSLPSLRLWASLSNFVNYITIMDFLLLLLLLIQILWILITTTDYIPRKTVIAIIFINDNNLMANEDIKYRE